MTTFIYDFLQSIITSWVGLYSFVFSVLYGLLSLFWIVQYMRGVSDTIGKFNLFYVGLAVSYILTYIITLC